MSKQVRAYAVLETKTVDEEQRIIEGTATTPSTDRMGDIVRSTGVKYRNPLPLLHHHNASEPVGTVRFNKPTDDGITFRAQLAKVIEPGILKDRIDLAWQEVKAGLVRGVSIGFRAIDFEWMDDGGIDFKQSEVLELSLVTIPANQDATISVIRSFVGGEAASGKPQPTSIKQTKTSDVVSQSAKSAKRTTTMAKKTFAEQIASFEATRAAKSARMDEIMNDAAENGTTLDSEQQDEYDEMATLVKGIDDHLVRLRAHEKSNRELAVVVEPVAAATQASATQVRSGIPAMPKRDHLFPGQGFVRYVKAVAEARGDHWRAFMIAKNNDRIARETPEVIDVLEMFTKTTVNVGTSSDATWAGPLVVYQNLQNEFINYLRPLTILGRIPGMRRVPFKVKIPRQTAAAAVNWVGEARVKPLTSLAFDTVTLDFNKIAGIIPLSEELVRLSDPSAEQTVRDDLAAAIVQFMDRAFVDPTAAATDVSPASITNGVSAVTATGTTMAALRADVSTLFSTFLQNNVQASNLVWLMTQTQALKIGLTLNSLGQPVYPGINVNGGNFLGIPVITSENVPYVGSSPTDGSYIILLNAGEVLLADDGQVTIDASREASLQFDTSPDSPPTASTNMISLWQMNMIAIKAERFVTWKMRRSNAVGLIQFAKYAE